MTARMLSYHCQLNNVHTVGLPFAFTNNICILCFHGDFLMSLIVLPFWRVSIGTLGYQLLMLSSVDTVDSPMSRTFYKYGSAKKKMLSLLTTK